MTLWTTREIQYVTDATSVREEDFPIQGLSTDSRDIQSGDLYVPLKGARFDGHVYIEQALKKGAVAALCAQKKHETSQTLNVFDVEGA